MKDYRLPKIEELSNDEDLSSLKEMLKSGFNQNEIDVSLGVAIAYSQIKTAEYLLSLGANISSHDYNGVFYAAFNNELEGLKFAISKGVDININNGMILNELINTSINIKDTDSLKWALNNGADLNLISKDTKVFINKYGSEDLKKIIKHD